MFIGLEGNIGSCKSTLLTLLSKQISNLKIYPERLSEWTISSDHTTYNLLDLGVNQPKIYAYTLQLVALMTHIDIAKEASITEEYVHIAERTIESNRQIFTLPKVKNGIIADHEYAIYKKMASAPTCIPCNGYIYLNTPPSICKDRIKIRNRPEESKVEINYINDIDNLHKKWLLHNEISPVLEINYGDSDKNNIELVSDFINMLWAINDINRLRGLANNGI